MQKKKFLLLFCSYLLPFFAFADTPMVRVVQVDADPYGFPRPAPNQTNVPLRTSFFLQLGIDKGAPNDKVDLDSLTVELQRDGEQPVSILSAGKKFAPGYRGKVSDRASGGGWGLKPSMSAWIDSDKTLEPLTTYTLKVFARSKNGAELSEKDGTWSFVTEEAPRKYHLSYQLDLAGAPHVEWKQGGVFTGLCNVGGNAEWIPGYEIMDAARKEVPRAWSLHRASPITGAERQPDWFWSRTLMNIERDLETRRITAMQKTADGVLLKLEDFFGHEQYDIPSDRPLSKDYQPGYEVMIADGVISTRTLVISINDASRSILVKPFQPDSSAWKIAYSGKLPDKEDPAAPGLFPHGGCYLQRFAPAGTPKFYWGRLDTEYDLQHRRLGRRIVANFLEVPGDMGIEGKGEFVPKDWTRYHDAVCQITAHIIDRYGESCLDWYWSIFNEPDLLPEKWRNPEGWNALQVFYDYSVDAILRAFEEKGYDSGRVIIGGIELGSIAGTNVRVAEFLGHCSPTGTAKGAVPLNAAFADKALDGKRSKRVEDLCRAHGGKGSPMDFISIHAYNRSEIMAAKLMRAKSIALEIDPVYYEKLIITSYETVPGWSPPPDPSARDSFLGNGYFSTWCADVTWRLLQKATNDPRYAYGEATITRWTGPHIQLHRAQRGYPDADGG